MPQPQDGEQDDFIDYASHSIGQQSSEKRMLAVESEVPSVNTSQQNLQNPQLEPNTGGDNTQDSTQHLGFGHRFPFLAFAARYTAAVVFVTVILAIPIIVTGRLWINGNSGNYSQVLVYYLFLWLLTSWVIGCGFNLSWRAFPYLFWWIAGFVNPAHQKYWRVFRDLNLPVTLLGAMIVSWVAFSGFINLNPLIHTDPDASGWDDVLDDVLFTAVMWSALYLLEKVLVLYICIHYHYRTDHTRIIQSKRMQHALTTLYEVSTYLHPAFQGPLAAEDTIIRRSSASGHATIRTDAEKFLQNIGLVVGHVLNGNEESRWMKPDSPYAIVSHALDNPRSAAALATRIWLSISTEGKDALTMEDIAEVLGPHRREEAQECFEALDENENKDIRLKELVLSTIHAGRTRQVIYKGIHEINHTINTFDWIAVTAIAFVMIFFILIKWVPQISALKEIVGFATLGLGFAIGRTVHEFLSGCIFIFFKHAYDLGDRVEIYNMAATATQSAIVLRISVLYTLFTCIEDGTTLQISNDRLALKRIKNITRSGANKERVSVFVDFTTSFTDIQLLKDQLQAFLARADNARDYHPALTLRVAAVHELQKLEIRCAFLHKSNWADENLRAARSSKFICALVAAIRAVPLLGPGRSILPVGDERRPNVTVLLSDDEALQKTAAAQQKLLEKRFDYVKPAPVLSADVAPALPEIRLEDEESLRRAQEDRQKAEKAKLAAAKAAEKAAAVKAAEKAALEALTVVPVVGVDGKEDARSSGSEIERMEFLHGMATGLRRKGGGHGQGGLYYP
ncbi:hypothetical protein MMC11_005566 [Xylographa trunciseda]|nr:hypothetical protein [Xylographa trunciseda]